MLAGQFHGLSVSQIVRRISAKSASLVSDRTLERYSTLAQLQKRGANLKARSRGEAEHDPRTQLVFGVTLCHLLAPYDNAALVYSPRTYQLDAKLARFILARALAFNFDPTSITTNKFGKLEVYITKVVADYYRDRHFAVTRIIEESIPRHVVTSRLFLCGNADSHVCTPVFVVKDPSIPADQIIVLTFPGLSHLRDGGSGQVWLVNKSHGAFAETIFSKYLTDIVLPSITLKMKELQDSKIARLGFRNSLLSTVFALKVHSLYIYQLGGSSCRDLARLALCTNTRYSRVVSPLC